MLAAAIGVRFFGGFFFTGAPISARATLAATESGAYFFPSSAIRPSAGCRWLSRRQRDGLSSLR